MLRKSSLCLACLLVGMSSLVAEVFLNTQSYPYATVERNSPFTLDLQEHFQRYADPGPVATFNFSLPVQDGFKTLYWGTGVDGSPIFDEAKQGEFMTYKLQSGETYNHIYGVYTEEFVWEQHSVQVQLLGDNAPIAVGNFISYNKTGEYKNTIIHRSMPDFVVQAGALRISEDDAYLLKWVETMPAITTEDSKENLKGTLSMAMNSNDFGQVILNSATSQFFVNVVDNTFLRKDQYTVFGELVDVDNDLQYFQQMNDVYQNWGLDSVFNTPVMTNCPIYTPFWDDKMSYVTIGDISIPEGNKDGVTYSWEFVDTLAEDATDEEKAEQAANQAVFTVGLEGSNLTVTRSGTGQAYIKVTGTYNGVSRSFETQLSGYSPEALDVYPSSSIELDGWLENAWYGRMQADTFPEIIHENHGKQYVNRLEKRNDQDRFLYYYYMIYDYRLESWIYTRAAIYPIIYVFNSGKWLEYVEGTGDTGSQGRWFYNFQKAEDANKDWWESDTGDNPPHQGS